MVWKSDTGGPMFKYYSAISLGIWIILAFVIFVALAVIASLADTRSEVGSGFCHLTTDDLRPTLSGTRSLPWAASSPARRWPGTPVSS